MTFPLSLGLGGGGPLDCFETARHLQGAGADLTVLPVAAVDLDHFPRSRPRDAQAGTDREGRLAAAGVRVDRVRPHPLVFLLDGRPVRRAVEGVLDRRPVDAVLSWHQEAAFLPELLRARRVTFGVIAAASYGRHVARRNLWPRWIDRRVDDRFLARGLRAADVVFARSAHTAGELVELFGVDPRRICVSHCGVDPVFAGVPRRRPDEVVKFLFFGALIRSKGIFDALEALGRLADRGNRRWTLRVAGTGDDEDVRRAAGRAGIADRVKLLGRLDRPALLSELEAAHLAIMPSRAESFGLGVAEAQAAALPVVGYAAGAIPEIVEDGVTGFLSPPGDVPRLAAAVSAAMADPERTFLAGLAGRERARRLFSWERTAGGMLEGLQSVWRTGLPA